MGKIIKRKPYVNKKSLYRKLAQVRKAKWAQRYHLQHQEQFKFHFCQGDGQESSQGPNKVSKNDHKTDQRVKNRLAAQQSREKKRNYVEQLEKKLDYYEELLETQTCRQCHGGLKEKSDTEMDMSEEKMELKDKQIQLEKYFQEGMIRVDNQGAHTPFAIFFFICFIVVLTIFTYRSGEGIDQRILSSYDSLLYNTRQGQEEMLKSSLNLKKSLSYFEMNHKYQLDSNAQDDNPAQKKKDDEAMSTNGNKWKKIGDLMCTKELHTAPEKPKITNSPYLMLRTADDRVKQEQKDTNEDEDWKKGDVLSCIIS